MSAEILTQRETRQTRVVDLRKKALEFRKQFPSVSDKMVQKLLADEAQRLWAVSRMTALDYAYIAVSSL